MPTQKWKPKATFLEHYISNVMQDAAQKYLEGNVKLYILIQEGEKFNKS